MPHPVLSLMDEDEQMVRIAQAFRNVFSSEDGLIVLNVLLEDMKFFDHAITPGEQALNNYAKQILVRAGLGDSFRLTEAMVNIIKKEAKNG